MDSDTSENENNDRFLEEEIDDSNELVLIEQLGDYVLLRGLFHGTWQFLQMPTEVFDEMVMDIIMEALQDKEAEGVITPVAAMEIAFHVCIHIQLDEEENGNDGDRPDEPLGGSPTSPFSAVSGFRSIHLGDSGRKN